jgi:tRNA(adenine34) deaminase
LCSVAGRLGPKRVRDILELMSERDNEYMRMALDEARAAARAGEVPVGAVIVLDGRVIARAGNRTIADCDPTAHAEVVALRAAAKKLGNYRLVGGARPKQKAQKEKDDAEAQRALSRAEMRGGAGATLYVTIEPCSMCAGAMVQARIARLVYGCDDPKGGAVRSCFRLFEHPALNHHVEVISGVLAEECAGVMQAFFAARR